MDPKDRSASLDSFVKNYGLGQLYAIHGLHEPYRRSTQMYIYSVSNCKKKFADNLLPLNLRSKFNAAKILLWNLG